MTIKDAAGKEVKVGDKVAYICTRGKKLEISEVVGLTPKGVNVKIVKNVWSYELGQYKQGEWKDCEFTLNRTPQQIIIIGE